MTKILLFIISLLILIIRCLSNLEFVPERSDLIYVNDKYLTNVTFTVRKYSRKSPYVFNMIGTFQQVWTNNVTIHIIVYEYLHNEYKRSFVEFHYKFCDFVNKDEFLGKRVKMFGLICPMPVGTFSLNNVTLAFPTFPQVFPIMRGKAEILIVKTSNEEIIAHGNLYVTVKQVKKH